MRERRNRKGMNTAKVAGWKKAVVLMLALIVCISSVVVPQPEEVSAKQAAYLDYYGKDKPKNQIVFATSDDAKWHKANEGCCNCFQKQWNIQSLSLHEKENCLCRREVHDCSGCHV